MKKWLIAIVGLLVCCTSVLGDGGGEPKFSYEATGDSVYEFEIKAKFEPAPDLSSPSGTVKAWCLLTDGRDNAASTTIMDRWSSLVAAELAKLESELLTDELAESAALERLEKEPSYVSVDHPTKIVEEVENGDGSRYVITEQESENKWKNSKGEWQSSKRTERKRYKMINGDDGIWRIAGIESGSGDGKEETWRMRNARRLEVALELRLADEREFEAPTLDMSGTNEAALSFCNGLRSFVSEANMRPVVVSAKAVLEVCEDWFTKAYIAVVTSDVERRLERSRKSNKKKSVPEVLEVRDETETAATVVFKKTDSKAPNQLTLKLKKVGNNWRVREVLKLWKYGTEDEWLEVKDDIYERN